MPIGGNSSGYQPGDIKHTAHGAIDPGFLACDGSAVSRAAYPALYAKIGTTWGAGDGSTTFNLPDLRSKSPMGAGQGVALSLRNIGTYPGEEAHTLTAGEMPVHNHPGTTDAQGAHNHPQNVGTQSNTQQPSMGGSNATAWGDYQPSPQADQSGIRIYTDNVAAHSHNVSTNNAGGGGAHNVVHPCAVVQFQIKF